MSFLLYSTIDNGQSNLEKFLKTLFSEDDIEVYHSFGHLSERLRKPVQENSIGVLAPGGREELLQLLSRRDLLRDIPTVLIAPDQQVETISIAHQLRPRFLTYHNGDFADLAAVLRKLAAVQNAKGTA